MRNLIKENCKMNYNYVKQELDKNLKTHFAIPCELIPELAEYRLVYWSAAYLYKRLMFNLEEDTGFNWYIDRQDILYDVTMQNCTIGQLYEIATNDPDRQIRISFRRARKHWNLPATAIIKLPAERKTLIDLRDSKGNYNHA